MSNKKNRSLCRKTTITKKVIMGLDLSLNGTGVAIFSGVKTIETSSIVITPKMVKEGMRGMRRLRHVLSVLMDVVDEYGVTHVVMEGYAYAASGKVFDIAELGGCVKLGLLSRKIHLELLPPAQVKQWVSGNGQTQKDKMLVEAFKLWGIDFDNSDEMDAHALATVGVAQFSPSLLDEVMPEGSLTQLRSKVLTRLMNVPS